MKKTKTDPNKIIRVKPRMIKEGPDVAPLFTIILGFLLGIVFMSLVSCEEQKSQKEIPTEITNVTEYTYQECEYIKVGIGTRAWGQKMTDQEILKFGEIQYLKGRLDELYKAIPTITNMERRRKLDQRIEKYITKLKKVDEVAYKLYEVQLNATHRVKVKGKLETENLLKEILATESITDEYLIKKIKDKIETL